MICFLTVFAIKFWFAILLYVFCWKTCFTTFVFADFPKSVSDCSSCALVRTVLSFTENTLFDFSFVASALSPFSFYSFCVTMKGSSLTGGNTTPLCFFLNDCVHLGSECGNHSFVIGVFTAPFFTPLFSYFNWHVCENFVYNESCECVFWITHIYYGLSVFCNVLINFNNVWVVINGRDRL